MRTRSLLLTTALVTALLTACSSSPQRSQSSALDLATAVCDLAFGCCTSGEAAFLLGPYVSPESCADRLMNAANVAPGVAVNLNSFTDLNLALPNLAQLDLAIAQGRTRVNPEALEACLTYISTLSCNEYEEPDPEEGCEPPEPEVETPCELDLIFEGTVPEGGECSSAGLGLAMTLECLPGLVCRMNASLGVHGSCVLPGDVGDYCFTDSECRIDLYCSQLDGTCQPFRLEGETCLYANRDDLNPSLDTLLLRCDEGLSCDPVTDTCVAICQRGARCGSDTQCDEEQELLCIQGRCDLPRAVALPCSRKDDCQEGLRCAPDPSNPGSMACAELLPVGVPCGAAVTWDEDCASGFCDELTGLCAETQAPGGLCLSGRHAECAEGYCETTITACTDDLDCPGSGSCDLARFRCDYYCVAARPDGGQCDFPAQCESDACIDGFCRTVPLALGQPCTADSQCKSEFCGLEEDRVCEELPLVNGSRCSSDLQCDSEVCYSASGGQRTCVEGLTDGERCDDPADPPCALDLFCDYDLDPPACVPVLEPGSPCDGDYQCRSACVHRFDRMICDGTPAKLMAFCDGV